MANNRTNTPAAPKVMGATDDASRGGFFSRENVANLVSGAEINEVAVNNGTITIDFTQTGQPTQQVQFTLNQSGDGTFMIALPDGGGTTPPVTGGGNPVVGGEVDSVNPNVLNLELMDGTIVDVDITTLATDTDITDVNTRIDNLNIPTMTSQLADWPTTGSAGQYLRMTVGGLIFDTFDPAAAGSSIAADNGRAPFGAAHPADLTGLTVDPATGFELQQLNTQGGILSVVGGNASGTYVFQRIPTTPPVTPPRPGTSTPIDDGSVFAPNAPVTTTFTVVPGTNGGGIGAVGDISTTVTRTDATNTRMTVTPTVSLTNPTTFDVTIPADMANEEGDYEISTTPIITDDNGDRTPVTIPPVTYSRFAPVFQADREIVAADINPSISADLDVSMAEFNGEFTTTAANASNTIFFAVPSQRLPSSVRAASIGTSNSPTNISVRHLSTFTVQDSEQEDIEYNSFQAQAFLGSLITRFRDRPFPTPQYTPPTP